MASTEIVLERSLYIGSYISGVLYGVVLLMYFMSVHFLMNNPNSRMHARLYIVYSTVVVFFLTIDIASNALFGQLMWIEHRDILGGPAAYFADNQTLWLSTLGTVAGVIVNFMGDAILLYRCYIIWSARISVIFFPAILYLASVSMAIISIYESAVPGAGFFHGQSVDYGVPFTSLSISLNVIVTALIVGRIINMRKTIQGAMGYDHTKSYTSIAAMLVESAAPFTIAGIIYVISYARNSPTAICFVQLWGKFCALSPQLIILRVSMGKGWTAATALEISRMDCASSTEVEISETPRSRKAFDVDLPIFLSSESPNSNKSDGLDSFEKYVERASII